jgi:hypothetical protein
MRIHFQNVLQAKQNVLQEKMVSYAGCSRPRACHCSDQSIGNSVRRFALNPRGKLPLMAKRMSLGSRKASDKVIQIDLSLLFSRVLVQRAEAGHIWR